MPTTENLGNFVATDMNIFRKLGLLALLASLMGGPVAPRLFAQQPIFLSPTRPASNDISSWMSILAPYLQAFGTPEKMQVAAEAGDPKAQLALGLSYLVGDRLQRNEDKAAQWFRKAAEQGLSFAQFSLATFCYMTGEGVPQDFTQAAAWDRKAAEQGLSFAQYDLGVFYMAGQGVQQDFSEAVKWFRKAADQGHHYAEVNLGACYFNGTGVSKDYPEAAKWYRKAAEQGSAGGQMKLGISYELGLGVPKNYVEAYEWTSLASAQGETNAARELSFLEHVMTSEQVAEAQALARKFTPRNSSGSPTNLTDATPIASGTGFFITGDGFLISAAHVVNGATQIRLVTSTGVVTARLVKLDAANDLALLKAEGRFSLLPVASSRTVKLGSTVATVGFPNTGMQGFAPKLAKGEIASLTGPQDDPRFFQVSVPVQPGNSGGALVDERGNVVGVVSAKLDAATALATSGAVPENVNYAVKSSFLLSFLESAPEVAEKMKQAATKEQKFEEVVKSVEEATVLVMVY